MVLRCGFAPEIILELMLIGNTVECQPLCRPELVQVTWLQPFVPFTSLIFLGFVVLSVHTLHTLKFCSVLVCAIGIKLRHQNCRICILNVWHRGSYVIVWMSTTSRLFLKPYRYFFNVWLSPGIEPWITGLHTEGGWPWNSPPPPEKVPPPPKKFEMVTQSKILFLLLKNVNQSTILLLFCWKS